MFDAHSRQLFWWWHYHCIHLVILTVNIQSIKQSPASDSVEGRMNVRSVYSGGFLHNSHQREFGLRHGESACAVAGEWIRLTRLDVLRRGSSSPTWRGIPWTAHNAERNSNTAIWRLRTSPMAFHLCSSFWPRFRLTFDPKSRQGAAPY